MNININYGYYTLINKGLSAYDWPVSSIYEYKIG